MSERSKARTALYDAVAHLQRAETACDEAMRQLGVADEQHAADDVSMLGTSIGTLKSEAESMVEEL